MTKKTEMTWFRVRYNYRRDNGARTGDFNQILENYTVNTNNANIHKLMSDFKKWAKSWSGQGYIEIHSITAGAFDSAQRWAENHNAKFAGKKIKFSNK